MCCFNTRHIPTYLEENIYLLCNKKEKEKKKSLEDVRQSLKSNLNYTYQELFIIIQRRSFKRYQIVFYEEKNIY